MELERGIEDLVDQAGASSAEDVSDEIEDYVELYLESKSTQRAISLGDVDVDGDRVTVVYDSNEVNHVMEITIDT